MNLPRWSYTLGWLAWVAAFGLLEIIALVDDDRGDTLSEHVTFLLDLHPVLWLLGLVGIIRLGWHFLFER